MIISRSHFGMFLHRNGHWKMWNERTLGPIFGCCFCAAHSLSSFDTNQSVMWFLWVHVSFTEYFRWFCVFCLLQFIRLLWTEMSAFIYWWNNGLKTHQRIPTDTEKDNAINIEWALKCNSRRFRVHLLRFFRACIHFTVQSLAPFYPYFRPHIIGYVM